MLRIPPRLSQERHLLGLRMFDNRMNWVYFVPPVTKTASADAPRQPAAPVETASLELA
jgi:hypothetical protein